MRFKARHCNDKLGRGWNRNGRGGENNQRGGRRQKPSCGIDVAHELTPYWVNPDRHWSLHCPSCKYFLLRHARHRVPASSHKQSMQLASHLHRLPWAGPSTMRPLKHRKGARQTRPNEPRPVGTSPLGHFAAETQSASDRYKLLRHRTQVFSESKSSVPPRNLHL